MKTRMNDTTRQQTQAEAVEAVELVCGALNGGPAAFGPIVQRYQSAVFGVAVVRLGNFHEAEDVAQQVFVEAFERLDGLRDPARLGGWLRTIAIHRSLDAVRRRKDVVPLDEAETVRAGGTPEEDLEREELRNRVMDAVGRLSTKQRETTTLFYIDGYSIDDIASMNRSSGRRMRGFV